MKQWLRTIFLGILLIFIVPATIVLLPFGLAGSWIWGRWLRARFRAKWSKQGKPILFVYSNSPHWQRYIEEHWLPQLQTQAVVLNWSERKIWSRQRPFEARVVHHFAGSREYNPLALYFPKQSPVRIVRFWQAFQDFKHGKERKLKEAEEELFEMLAQIRQGEV